MNDEPSKTNMLFRTHLPESTQSPPESVHPMFDSFHRLNDTHHEDMKPCSLENTMHALNSYSKREHDYLINNYVNPINNINEDLD